MISYIINRLICFFAAKYRKQGFTLAEALIITVMTGACLLPILGTMQNAQVRTENFDHQSKMQQYARSRLTAEIANAAFDHKSINLDDEYHYIVFFAENGNPDEAKKLELVKTYINKIDLKALNDKEVKSSTAWTDDACALFGIKKANNSHKPYIKIIHAYKTTVETKDNPELAAFASNSNTEESIVAPRALLAIVVKTSLIESDDHPYSDEGYLEVPSETEESKYVKDESVQVVPVTLFAFANLPLVSDEMIWLADALNCKIYGIDPVSKVLGKTIDLPRNSSGNTSGTIDDNYRPWHLAVHPSLKILACSTKKHLYVINIDKKSGNFGDYSKSFEFPSEVKVNGGIAFRPDGRYLFVCPEVVSNNYKLTTFKVDYHIVSDKIVWKPKDAVASEPNFIKKNRSGSIQNDKDIVAVLAANDGYLYVARKDRAYGVIRYPMYNPDVDKDVTWSGEKIVSSANGLEGEILSIDVSPDGSRLAIVASGSESLFIYDTRDGKQILRKKITEVSGVTDFKPNNVAFTAISNSLQSGISDDKNLNLTITNKESGKDTVANVFYVEKTAGGNELKKLRDIKYQDNKGGNFAVNSADNTSVIVTDKEKDQVYFGTTGTDNNPEDLSNTEGSVFQYSRSPENTMNCTSIATTKRDILAVAKEDRTMELFDINTLSKLEDTKYDTSDVLKGISFNPTGDMLLGYYGSARYGYTRFHVGDMNLSESSSDISKSEKYIFDDRIPNMVFSLEDDGSSQNAFFNASGNFDNNWDTSDSAYDRHDFDLDRTWIRYDMIGMPNGGALVLYGKGGDTDGSSMIEWIGRRSWAQDSQKGIYRLFARWTNINTSSSESIIPSYGLDDVNSYQIDQDTGIVVIDSNHQLTPGYVVKSVTLKTGKSTDPAGSNVEWTEESEEYSRYVTPIIFKKNPSGTQFEIYDYADPLYLEPDQTYSEIELKWLIQGGYIPANDYYIGFWNGDALSDSKSKGAIAYINAGGNYVANYLYGGNQSISFSEISNNPLDLPDARYIGNSSRKYAITFKLEEKSFNSDFPPLYSRKLAISPDCGTLAILCRFGNNGNSGDDAIPIVKLYDFNNYNFGAETQIEGMLVDYRQQFHSGAWNGNHVVPPTRRWPNEENNVDFFKSVSSQSHFKSDQLNKFSLATTKNDSWTSFNYYPANYMMSDTDPEVDGKGRANKRFFGYIRPETDYKYMQMYFTDEPRIFINNSFVYGCTEFGSNHFLADSLPVFFSSYSSNLFQLDHASNSGGMYLSLFFNSNASNYYNNDIEQKQIYDNPGIVNKYNAINGNNLTRGWKPLISSDTYILNNYPSFIKSYFAFTSGAKIDLDYASMVFSRDRAKPVLYIKGRYLLGVVYKNRQLRLGTGSDIPTSKNIVISSDGQKLLLGKGNNLNIYNINNFNETEFLSEAKTYSLSGPSDDYLGLINSIDFLATPTYLAVKPYNSLNSSKIGGDFDLLKKIDNFTVYSNAAVVASGGIYIAKSGSNDIGFFKPLDNTFEVKSDALQKDSNYAAVTAYDNKVYLFGNSGVTGDPISGRVQSFDVNTEDSLTSMDDAVYTNSEYVDSYQVSMGVSSAISGGSNYPKNFGVNSTDSNKYNGINGYLSASGVGHLVHAFVSCVGDWANNITCSSYIDLSFDLPLTVNQVLVSNTNESGVTDFTLLGSDNDFVNYDTLWNNSAVPIANNQKFDTDKYTHKKFRLKLNSGSTLGLFQLRRKDVKRLTPPLQSSSSDLSGADNQSLTWTRLDGETTYMKWATNKNNNSLKNTFINNNTDNNNWFSSYPSYWECDAPKPWILVSLSKAEAVCTLRYANAAYSSSDTKAKTVKLYGSNDILPANIYTILPDALNVLPPHQRPRFHWEQIRFTNNRNDYCAPRVLYDDRENRYAEETFVTAEIKQPKKFKHYLFVVESKIKHNQPLKLIGFELFSTYLDGEVGVTRDYLTPMTTDNLSSVKLGKMAACSTPYGLVCAGGAAGSAATSTALLYWPHGINKYDGQFYEYGISRSLPDLHCPRYNHSLVWHKGKIYAIGGLKNSSEFAKNYSGDAFIECLDYNNNLQWRNVETDEYIFPDGGSVGMLLRESFGACSFGDEIFIFGGDTNYDGEGDNTNLTAYAWNPETKIVRRLKDLPNDIIILKNCSAVPCGSKIYVMGMDNSSPAKFRIYEYTP